jgi:hypothetical protein
LAERASAWLSCCQAYKEQISLLRRLFLAAASETVTDRDSVTVGEYLAAGLTLSAGEIGVLAAYYRYLPKWRSIPSAVRRLSEVKRIASSGRTGLASPLASRSPQPSAYLASAQPGPAS